MTDNQLPPAAPLYQAVPPQVVDVRLSLFANRLILRQLGMALGLSIAFLLILMLALMWPPDAGDLLNLLAIGGLVSAIIGVLFLLAMGLIYGGRYHYRYTFDEQGVEARPFGRTAGTNRVVNLLLLLSGRPGPMGAGALAASRTREYAAWTDVDRVVGNERDCTVNLYHGRRRVLTLLADREHYVELCRLASEAIERADGSD